MALNTREITTIGIGIAAAKKVLQELEPVLHQLNISYDDASGVKGTITQPNLDLATAYSGLTKAQLDDGMFALTSTLKTAVNNAYVQLQILASRG